MTGRRSPLISLGSLVLPLCLAGCATALPPPAVPSNVTPAAAANRRKEHVRVVIRIPRERRGRRDAPKFISPATQSMSVLIEQNNATVLSETVGLTPTSTGCASTLASVTCMLELSLPAGTGYTASITTFDNVNATGAPLSTAQSIPFTVTTGTSNLIPLTLSGIPAHIVTSLGKADSFFVWALDADGNAIVGAGAPSFKAAKTAGSTIVSIVQPTTASPNLVTVAVVSPRPATGSETIGVTASYAQGLSNGCSVGGVCSLSSAATATLSSTQELFTANPTNSRVQGFTVPFAGPTPSPDVTIAMNSPGPIALDSNGDVFTAPAGGYASDFYFVTPPYTAAPSTGIAPNPAWLSFDSEETLYVLSASVTYIDVSEFSPPYTSLPWTYFQIPNIALFQDAFDASNNLYVLNYNPYSNPKTYYLTVYAPPYTGAPAFSVRLSNEPTGLVVEAEHALVLETQSVEVVTLPMVSNTPPVTTITSGLDVPAGVAEDANGDLFVANAQSNTIDEYAAPYTSASTPVATIATDKSPKSLLFDLNGNLYVTTTQGGPLQEGSLEEFSPPFSSSSVPAVDTSTGLSSPSNMAIVQTAKGSSFSLTTAAYSAKPRKESRI